MPFKRRFKDKYVGSSPRTHLLSELCSTCFLSFLPSRFRFRFLLSFGFSSFFFSFFFFFFFVFFFFFFFFRLLRLLFFFYDFLTVFETFTPFSPLWAVISIISTVFSPDITRSTSIKSSRRIFYKKRKNSCFWKSCSESGRIRALIRPRPPTHIAFRLLRERRISNTTPHNIHRWSGIGVSRAP